MTASPRAARSTAAKHQVIAQPPDHPASPRCVNDRHSHLKPARLGGTNSKSQTVGGRSPFMVSALNVPADHQQPTSDHVASHKFRRTAGFPAELVRYLGSYDVATTGGGSHADLFAVAAGRLIDARRGIASADRGLGFRCCLRCRYEQWCNPTCSGGLRARESVVVRATAAAWHSSASEQS